MKIQKTRSIINIPNNDLKVLSSDHENYSFYKMAQKTLNHLHKGSVIRRENKFIQSSRPNSCIDTHKLSLEGNKMSIDQ